MANGQNCFECARIRLAISASIAERNQPEELAEVEIRATYLADHKVG